MDKKSIVNDLYQAAVISVLAVGWLFNAWKEDIKDDSTKHSKV